MLERLFQYLLGYVILELCGSEKERFINLCKNREIEIIHIFSINDTWYCKITCRQLKKIKNSLRKTGCRMRIKKKRGLPFLLQHMKKRKGLLIGSVLFLLILTQFSGRIWHIDVDGGFIHTREQMLQVIAEELNVYAGVPKELVDCFEIEKRLRLDYNEIGWISVEKRGCCLFVRMNESTMPKQVFVQEIPSHIIAGQDGVVKKIEVLAGVPMVKVGDNVKKGDILISGVIPIIGDFNELLRKQAVCAVGAVYIESDFSYNTAFPMRYEKKNYTGERKGLELFLFGRKLFSYIPRYSVGKYDIMSNDIVPYAFEDYQVPVLLRMYRYIPYTCETVHMTEQEAKEKAQKNWEEFLSDWKEQGVQIIQAVYSLELQQGYCFTAGTVTACGNFISYQEIMEEEWKIQDEHRGDNP